MTELLLPSENASGIRVACYATIVHDYMSSMRRQP